MFVSPLSRESLLEGSTSSVPRVMVDVTMTFDEAGNSSAIINRLFQVVRAKKKLDEMPVFSNTLKMKGESLIMKTFLRNSS